MGNVPGALIFLVKALFSLYITAVILRLILPLVGADFNNQLSQFVVQITAKPLHLLRRVIPPIGKVDSACILLLLILQLAVVLLICLILGKSLSPLAVIGLVFAGLLNEVLNLFMFSIVVLAIVSWLRPDPYNPFIRILMQITAPLLEPVRRVMPSAGGLDFSPMLVMIGLFFLKTLVQVPPPF